MELTKNIFFNTDKLVGNTTVKVSYTGGLFQNGCDSVSIHYGFNSTWDNVADIAMEKTELGFQAEVALPDADTLNFCFYDSNTDTWDNNDGQNYTFSIEKIDAGETALTVQDADENDFLAPTTHLRKSYIWSKKIKLAVYKIITYLPKLISGNYKRKLDTAAAGAGNGAGTVAGAGVDAGIDVDNDGNN